jgi:hypothetical protein
MSVSKDRSGFIYFFYFFFILQDLPHRQGLTTEIISNNGVPHIVYFNTNRQIMQIQLVEEITRRRKRYKKIYFYTGTDRCGCYLAVDVYPKGFI